MRLADFVIIYLSLGAPFAVYFFIQHRDRQNSSNVYLRSLALLIVWIPYAVKLLDDFITRNFRQVNYKQTPALILDNSQKQLLQMLCESNTALSIFEAREIIERYKGLSLAHNSADESPSKSDEELFRVALRQNIKLGAECLHRRNRLRIECHQKLARNDFSKIVQQVALSISDLESFRLSTMKFVEFLNDETIKAELSVFFTNVLQSREKLSVQYMEKELWTRKELNPSMIKKNPASLLTASAAKKT